MNDLTIPTAAPGETLSLALPADLAYPTWLEMGRNLAEQRRNIDWLLGDWVQFGRQQFPEQIALALEELAEDPKRLKRIEQTVAAFPPHKRDSSLSFDHHAHVADLPTQEALPLLKKAHDENMTARQVRTEAMLRKLDIGMNLPREDDPEHDHLLAMARAWNRSPKEVRLEFAEMIRESGGGVIDP